MKKFAGFILKYLILPVLALFLLFYFWASGSHTSREYYSSIESYDHSKPYPGDTFSIITYNIGYLSGMTNNLAVEPEESLYRTNLDSIVSFLSNERADFVAFQEIDFGSSRSFQYNQLDSIAAGCDYSYGAVSVNWDKRYVPFPYWPPSVHFGKMLSGQAILSKFPFVSNKRVVLQKPESAPFYYNAFYLDRLLQIVQVDIGRPLIIMNVHLEAFDTQTRQNQAETVKNYFEEYSKSYPVILLGDFNARPPFASSHVFDENTIETIMDVKSAAMAIPDSIYLKNERDYFTYSSGEPVEKIGYIFYTSDKIKPVEGGVLGGAGEISDHLPVKMKFIFVD
jgi:endonuclease/exonuclease/phosphatase family metal-dependent hydrolase